jgi:hypothetical protein
LTRRKQDRTLDYLKKIDKEVGNLRKEVSDIRKMMESSKIMKEADDMYNPEFINVSIFYLFFLQKKIILLIIF